MVATPGNYDYIVVGGGSAGSVVGGAAQRERPPSGAAAGGGPDTGRGHHAIFSSRCHSAIQRPTTRRPLTGATTRSRTRGLAAAPFMCRAEKFLGAPARSTPRFMSRGRSRILTAGRRRATPAGAQRAYSRPTANWNCTRTGRAPTMAMAARSALPTCPTASTRCAANILPPRRNSAFPTTRITTARARKVLPPIRRPSATAVAIRRRGPTCGRRAGART